jgi:hypothetical protein
MRDATPAAPFYGGPVGAETKALATWTQLPKEHRMLDGKESAEAEPFIGV